MNLEDIIITPIYLVLTLVITYILIKFSKGKGKEFAIPALLLKIVCAISIGLIYQYYYNGGDTYGYFFQGKLISQALREETPLGIKILFSKGDFNPDIFKYTSRMYYYQFAPEFLIVKITGILCLIGFNNYSTVALLFATLSFTGLWSMYQTWLKINPNMKLHFAIAIFFIPSVFFWGSGILKDSITLGALGWIFTSSYNILIERKKIVSGILILIINICLIYVIKIYILLALLPPLAFWVILEQNRKVTNNRLKNILLPTSIVLGIISAVLIFQNITQGDEKYNLDAIGKRAKISADWLYYVSVKEGGSAYYLGELDGSIESMVSLSPKALFVTLFRPFIWEAKNILMLISALEVFLLTLFFFYVLSKVGILNFLKISVSDPFILLCVSFTVIMAIGVGLTTFNFGTLVRYKIPLLPFYYVYLAMILNYKSHHH